MLRSHCTALAGAPRGSRQCCADSVWTESGVWPSRAAETGRRPSERTHVSTPVHNPRHGDEQQLSWRWNRVRHDVLFDTVWMKPTRPVPAEKDAQRAARRTADTSEPDCRAPHSHWCTSKLFKFDNDMLFRFILTEEMHEYRNIEIKKKLSSCQRWSCQTAGLCLFLCCKFLINKLEHFITLLF